jgi:DeoR family glycerol-3-phosphate regulon repressor
LPVKWRQIPNGATLFIDIGTTPEAVAHALLDHENLRVVTNNLNVANTLMQKDDFRIILAGGELRSRDGGLSVKRRSTLSLSSASTSAFWDQRYRQRRLAAGV